MEIFSSPSSRARERRTERRCPHGARAQRARLQEKPRPLSWGRGYLPRPGPEEASRSSAATHRVRRWPCVLPEGCAAGGGARAGMAAVGKRRGDAAGYLRPPAAAAIEGEPMSRRQEQRRGGPAPSRRPPPPALPPPPTWPRSSRQPPHCHRPWNRRHSQQRPREREEIKKRGTLLWEWLLRYRKQPGRSVAPSWLLANCLTLCRSAILDEG